jgi:hypothetical protein
MLLPRAPRRGVVERSFSSLGRNSRFSSLGRNSRFASDFANLAETLTAFLAIPSTQLAVRCLARL